MLPNFVSFFYALRLAWESQALSLDERLRRACARNDLEQVKALVAQGANVHAERPRPEGIRAWNTSNRTPLHVAAVCGNPAVVDWLLSHGANARAFDRPLGETPMHLAAMQLKECMKNGADAQAFRDVLGLLWLANPDAFEQQNKWEISTLHELGDDAAAPFAWGQAYRLGHAVPTPEPKEKIASLPRRPRL